MALHIASFEWYVFYVVAWQNILNRIYNFVQVLSSVGTESKINVGYRQLSQNLSHTRNKESITYHLI